MTHEIVPATEAYLEEIEVWLDTEEAEYQVAAGTWMAGGCDSDKPSRGFRCNWDSVKRSWREGYSRLHVLRVCGETVGFLDGTDILEVRTDLRGKGYGRLLAQFMIDRARQEDLSVLEIEIAPLAAEPFWRHMGFTAVPHRKGPGGGIYAYRVLHRVHDLGEGERLPFEIRFYTESGRYRAEPQDFSRFKGLGESLPDRSVQLPERAYCFEPADGETKDYFVSIEIDGEQIYFDKCKYDESKLRGINFGSGHVYFIDRVLPLR